MSHIMLLSQAKRQKDHSLGLVRREDIKDIISKCVENITLYENTNIWCYDTRKIEIKVCTLIAKICKNDNQSKPERKKREVEKDFDLKLSAEAKCLSAQEEIPSKHINPWNLMETFQVIETEDSIATDVRAGP